MMDDRAASRIDTGLADRLKTETLALHREAERTGIMADLLRGQASLAGYALLLRNLLPVYAMLEQQLDAVPPGSPAAALARPAVYRAAALQSDLEHLIGPGALGTLPVLPAGQRYIDEIRRAGGGDGTLLIAHAYTRYLGDLNGGQILGRLLAKRMGLAPAGLSFYRFAGIDEPAAAALLYRSAIDAADVPAARIGAILDEAILAFRCNIDLSHAVQHATGEAATTS